MTAEEAFAKGYQDFKVSVGSMSLSAEGYSPPEGMKDAYAAGWGKAADEASRLLFRRQRRGDIILNLVLGSLLLFVGILVTSQSDSQLTIVWFGAIIAGAIMLFRAGDLLFGKHEASEQK